MNYRNEKARSRRAYPRGVRGILCVLVLVFALTSVAAAQDVMSYTARDIDWLTQAAEGGDSSAWLGLGYVYYLGDYNNGVERDFSKALEYFEKAADAGNVEILPTLARMYEKGTGCERDLGKAYDYYKKAADAGDADSAERLTAKQFGQYRWKDNATLLTGRLGESENAGGRMGYPLYLDAPVLDCDKITLELRVIEYTGYPFGRYALRAKGVDGNWRLVDYFDIVKGQADGQTLTFQFTPSEPLSFVALAIVNAEDGMYFNLSHDDAFYVDKVFVSEYSDSVPAPSFTPCELEHPSTAAYTSYDAYVNPFE